MDDASDEMKQVAAALIGITDESAFSMLGFKVQIPVDLIRIKLHHEPTAFDESIMKD